MFFLVFGKLFKKCQKKSRPLGAILVKIDRLWVIFMLFSFILVRRRRKNCIVPFKNEISFDFNVFLQKFPSKSPLKCQHKHYSWKLKTLLQNPKQCLCSGRRKFTRFWTCHCSKVFWMVLNDTVWVCGVCLQFCYKQE